MHKSIPANVKREVEHIVEQFNREHLAKQNRAYSARFCGRYLYIDRDDGVGASPICRLEFWGTIDDWGFAIYKYSSNSYDQNEHRFPGDELFDGTVQGAMHAGLHAYP